jgi:hypothetical protein
MSIPLVIQGVTYSYPESGSDPNWAEEASSWAQAVTTALNSLLGSGDILLSTATIANNQATLADVSGMLFDPTSVRAANISYVVYRITDSITFGNAESGTIYITYDNNATPGSKWTLSQQLNGYSGVTFSVTDLGQLQYLSSNLAGTGYSGSIRFSAKTLSS